MSPRRPARDIESVNRVLAMLGWLLVGVAVLVLAYGGWRVFEEFGLEQTGRPAYRAVVTLVLIAVFAGTGFGCLRLSRDNGSGTWCEQCLARNPADAEVCETCGADLS